MAETHKYSSETFTNEYRAAMEAARASLRTFIGLEAFEDKLSESDFKELIYRIFEPRPQPFHPETSDFFSNNPASYFFAQVPYTYRPVVDEQAAGLHLYNTYPVRPSPDIEAYEERVAAGVFEESGYSLPGSLHRDEEIQRLKKCFEPLARFAVYSILHDSAGLASGICIGGDVNTRTLSFEGIEIETGSGIEPMHILNGGLLGVQIRANAPAIARLTLHPTSLLEELLVEQTTQVVGRKDTIGQGPSAFREQFLVIENGENWTDRLGVLSCAPPGSRLFLCETVSGIQQKRPSYQIIGDYLPSFHKTAEHTNPKQGTVMTVFEKLKRLPIHAISPSNTSGLYYMS